MKCFQENEILNQLRVARFQYEGAVLGADQFLDGVTTRPCTIPSATASFIS